MVIDGRDSDSESVCAAFASESIRVSYLAQPKAGAGAARNAGARLAEGDLLIFCDDDIAVEPPHVYQHVDTHRAYGSCVVNAREEWPPATLSALNATPLGRFRISLKEKWRPALIDRPLGTEIHDPQSLVACNMSIRRDVFWDIGGFDEDFGMGGAEDRDLGLRAQRAGLSLIRNDLIKVWHADPTSSLRAVCSREERYARGIALLADKYPDLYAGVAFISENSRVSRRDSPRLVAKKVIKACMVSERILAAVHWLIEGLERRSLPDRYLHRCYSVVLGLYIYRGIRTQLATVRSHPSKLEAFRGALRE